MVSQAFRGKSILVVDDDPDIVTAILALLEDTGAELSTATDGNAALVAAEENDPDLIVLDAMLPKRSGFLVMERLKSAGKKHGQKPHVIMITAGGGKRHKDLAESLGVDGYLNKPFRMEILMQTVEKCLSD